MSRSALILASIWPEAAASAASTRTLQLIGALQAAGYRVVCASDAKTQSATAALETQGVICERVLVNDASFDSFVQSLDPELVLFDRFTTEEKFSWRVRAQVPAALRILDTIDLHCLRLGREAARRAGHKAPLSYPDLLRFAGDVAAREIAAIYRSDLSLLVSDYELVLLTTGFGVPRTLLHLCRLAYAEAPKTPGFTERCDYVMLGNFRHPPNADAVLWLKQEIWPRIRKAHPGAKVHVWGAHAAPHHRQLSRPDQGFCVHGYLEQLSAELGQRRVNLAPLRAGAGIKGKIADGWWCGLPAVTTAVGAEGMHEDYPFGGLVAEDPIAIAEAAVTLYHDPQLWGTAQSAGYRILGGLYTQEATVVAFLAALEQAWPQRDARRQQNFTGHMLWQQGLRSTEYFSRWIEAKQARNQEPGLPAPT